MLRKMKVRSKYQIFEDHQDAICCIDGEILDGPVQAFGIPDWCGPWGRTCSKCGYTTYYTLPKERINEQNC